MALAARHFVRMNEKEPISLIDAESAGLQQARAFVH
jgi:hypothetical protein